MAGASSNMSPQTLTSLSELSVELKALGLKPLISRESSSSEELCEALLSSAWMLINLVHSRAMGLDNCPSNFPDREALLHSEKLSLEMRLESLRKDIALKDDMLANELKNIYKIEKEREQQDLKIQKQNHLITQLTNKLKCQEKDFHHEVRRLEAQCEQLRELIRKSSGMGWRPTSEARIQEQFATLRVSDMSAEHLNLLKSSQERLKSSNSVLIGENLMLRDALKLLHHDIQHIIESRKHPEANSTNIPLEAFYLPLEFTLNKLKELRQVQMTMLHKLVI